MTKKDREAMIARVRRAGFACGQYLRESIEREVDRAVRKARREERHGRFAKIAEAAWIAGHDAAVNCKATKPWAERERAK